MPTTYPASSIVSITDSLGQGSGVLISPDEVLTAAHVVYNSGTGIATNIQVSPGYAAGTAPFGTVPGVSAQSEHVATPHDTISLQQSQTDFAVIHLAQPVVEAGTMALGMDFTHGTLSLSGYPYLAGGNQVTITEPFTKNPSYALLDGRPILGASTDAAGSSGGPVWQNVGIKPMVFGLVSSTGQTQMGEQGYFVQLTGQDVSTIDGWVAQDDKGEVFGDPSAALLNALDPIASALRGDAASQAGTQPRLAAHETGALTALDDALYLSNRGTSLDALFQTAESDATANSRHPLVDTAFLAGLIYGQDQNAAAGLGDAVAVAAQFPDLTPTHAAQVFAAEAAGFRGSAFVTAHPNVAYASPAGASTAIAPANPWPHAAHDLVPHPIG